MISPKPTNFKHIVPVALADEDFQILKFERKHHHLLKFDERNRDTDALHVEKLKKLMKQNGLLRFPIVAKVRDSYHFLDGQHISRGILKNKKTIYAFFCKGNYIKNMFDINDSSKKMKNIDCVRALKRNDDINCSILWTKLIDKTIKKVLKPALVMRLYATKKGSRAMDRREATRAVRERKYKITNDTLYCDTVVKQIKEILVKGIPHTPFYCDSLITIITELGDKYDHQLFLDNISKSYQVKEKKFKLKEKEAYIQLREIYDNKKHLK